MVGMLEDECREAELELLPRLEVELLSRLEVGLLPQLELELLRRLEVDLMPRLELELLRRLEVELPGVEAPQLAVPNQADPL